MALRDGDRHTRSPAWVQYIALAKDRVLAAIVCGPRLIEVQSHVRAERSQKYGHSVTGFAQLDRHLVRANRIRCIHSGKQNRHDITWRAHASLPVMRATNNVMDSATITTKNTISPRVKIGGSSSMESSSLHGSG
jgi:hypothetical protein